MINAFFEPNPFRPSTLSSWHDEAESYRLGIYEEQARKAAEIAANEQEERDRGQVMECGCCFDDIPMSKITHCNGETAHFFCYDCARMNAENDIGSNKYGLQCMDGCVCKASFSRSERAKFLDGKTIEKLENLEQQAAIRLAMDDLSDYVTCPFCNYGHICPPIEVDKEFRCGYPVSVPIRHPWRT